LVEAIARQYSAEGGSKSHITGKLKAVDKLTALIPLQKIFKELDDKTRRTLSTPIDFKDTSHFEPE